MKDQDLGFLESKRGHEASTRTDSCGLYHILKYDKIVPSHLWRHRLFLPDSISSYQKGG
jgi:hypothetical protein